LLICDGQSSMKVESGERVIIRRSPDDVVLIAGSLYVVGAARAALVP